MNIFLEQFIKKNFKKTGFALDLGCGKGYDAVCLRECFNWSVRFIDKKRDGIDLEEYYKHCLIKFDLVYSNYVLHLIENKDIFLKSAYDNLKKNGWLFLHLLSIEKKDINKLLKDTGFKDIKYKKIDFYDNDIGHKHWHKILEVTARK